MSRATGSVYCTSCRRRLPAAQFSTASMQCAKCTGGKTTSRQRSRASRSTGSTSKKNRQASNPPRVVTRKCPNCLLKVPIEDDRFAAHENRRDLPCRGSGEMIPEVSNDAFDYRVSGSFEGGRR